MDMDIHGYIHGDIHGWISRFWSYPWILWISKVELSGLYCNYSTPFNLTRPRGKGKF